MQQAAPADEEREQDELFADQSSPSVALDDPRVRDGLVNPNPLPCPRCGGLDVVSSEVAQIQGISGGAQVLALVCRGCGHTELHTPDADELTADGEAITERAGFVRKR